MKVLIIDNIDSFVYNIFQYVGMLGVDPIIVQNTADLNYIEKIVKTEEIKHIIISPGPKTPKEAGITNQVIKKFYKSKILGVCLGHQCIGYVFGGNIRRAKKIRHGKSSLIKHNEKEIFKGLKNPFSAIRYHSLVIDDKLFPNDLEITARSLDDNEIMAIRHRKYDIFGIQFHPESILTEQGIKLIKNFIDM